MEFFCYTCNKESPSEVCPKCKMITEPLLSYEDLEGECYHENLWEYAGLSFCVDCGQSIGEDLIIKGRRICIEKEDNL